MTAQSNVNPGVVVQELPERNIGLTVPVKSFVATAAGAGAAVLPGRTVFVGDSFTAVALGQLSQLSAETVFIWTDSKAPLQPMLDEIAQGDRVVVEVVERFATRFRMFRPDVVEGVRALPRPPAGAGLVAAGLTARPGNTRPAPAVGQGVERRRGRRLAGPVLLAAVLLVGAVRWGQEAAEPDCRLTVAGEQVGLSVEQARDATTLAAVTRREGLTQQDLADALGPALDAPAGTLTPDAAVRTLRAEHPAATPAVFSLGRALLGYGTDRLACTARPGEVAVQEEGPAGLTPRAAGARDALLAVTGSLPLGGFAPGGVRSGHTRGSAHYEGRAVDVFFRPVTDRNRQRGWTTAQWLVAHAEPLDLDVVIFDRQVWSAGRSEQGWRDYRPPDGPTTNPVLLHLDHVHVDVARGQA